jgi:Fe2+ or Zn2+ uptake regulation protein
VKKTLYHNALERLNRYVKANDLRPSVVRTAVLEQACYLPQPFTAKQLIAVCQEQRISVGTVYNSLNLFISAHILHATERQRGKMATEYEVIAGAQHRMQIICQKCGRVADIQDKAIARLIRERKYSNFALQSYSLFVYGECKVCRRQKS